VPPGKLSAEARERLLAHAWPGNVRELENALERALILAGEDDIRADHLGTATTAAARPRKAGDLLGEGFDLDAFEREVVYAALERAGGNKTHAAKLLGITRRRLYSMLASFGAAEQDDG
jgi:DNA-binding NtrC family response regulator